MKNYGTARALLSILAGFGVVGILAGVLFMAFGPSRSLLESAMLGAPLIFGGLVMMAIGELGTALLDTASNTAEIARLMREQVDSQKR